ncbi:MAG: amino acid--tRNA ligase-related protein, partial [bacterium]|nr:amino acid--tRNA ligase-related protein [bacterium]
MRVKDNIKTNTQGKLKNINYDKHFSNIVLVNQSLNFGAWDYYKHAGLTYVDVQEIVGITGACENVDTLFKVQNRLSLPLFMTQTGQLSLEQSLQSFHGAFTVIHSGRDEEVEDERHLRQFRLTEEEFDCTFANMTRKNYDEEKMFEALLNHIQASIQSMIKNVLKNNEGVLKNDYGRNIKALKEASEKNFLRIEYGEAVKLLNKNGFPKLAFGDDLISEHEAKIVHLLNKSKGELPVFIMKYPKEIKFFNMKVSEKDTRVVLSADLILPYAGEATGSAVREHDFEKLNERLKTSKMYELHIKRGGKYTDFTWYLDIVKGNKTLPHAGYGIGNERVLQYIFAESDIRNTSLFSLLDIKTGNWSPKRYGQAGIIENPKKHILLSIGRDKNKKLLLSYIKLLSKNKSFVLYATENTHKFLAKNKVLSSMVYKISELG